MIALVNPDEPARWVPERRIGSRPRSQAMPVPRITLDQLRIFSAVAEREHLTGAAKALRLSQGSVSVQVRRLERALGLPLLQRVGRNVRLTDVGRGVHRQAIETLKSAQSIEDLATSYRQATQGQLVVAAGSVIGAHRLSGWLSPFVTTHPGIDVHISIAPFKAALESVTAGSVDVVIVGAAVTAPTVETIALERTELVIVVGSQHPLATQAHPLADLNNHRHLAHERGSATELHASDVLGQLADASPRLELGEEALLAALHTGLGYAVMPRAIIEPAIESGMLTVLRNPSRAVPVTFTAVRRVGPHTPLVDALWTHLRQVARGNSLSMEGKRTRNGGTGSCRPSR